MKHTFVAILIVLTILVIPVTTVRAQEVTLSQVIELFISAGFINSQKASIARNVLWGFGVTDRPAIFGPNVAGCPNPAHPGCGIQARTRTTLPPVGGTGGARVAMNTTPSAPVSNPAPAPTPTPAPASVPIPTLSLSGSKSSITEGESLTLTWDADDAGSCNASWTSSSNTSGSQTVSPTQTTTYRMDCDGAGGSVSDRFAVTVNALVPQNEFVNGTYTASATYLTPPPSNHEETVSIDSLTIVDDVVTAVSTSYIANDPTSEVFQDVFDDNYKSEVIGKKLDAISLSRVGGSSLTPIGFNAAIDKIIDQARS